MSKLVFNKIKISLKAGGDTEEVWELASWYPTKKLMVIYAPAWKQVCISEEAYVGLTVDVIHHEVLHGVIDSIVEEDDLEPSNDHWPHLNGLDEPYTRDWE